MTDIKYMSPSQIGALHIGEKASYISCSATLVVKDSYPQ